MQVDLRVARIAKAESVLEADKLLRLTLDRMADGGLQDTLLRELLAVLPGKQAADIVARVTGGGRNAVYQRMLALKDEQS